MDATVPVAAAAVVEYLAYADAEACVLVELCERSHLIAVACLGQSDNFEQIPPLMRRPQALHQDRLLPVGEHPRVGALAFSQKLPLPIVGGGALGSDAIGDGLGGFLSCDQADDGVLPVASSKPQ